MFDVIGIGTAVKDFLFAVEKIPEGDNGARALYISSQFGGKVATAMAAVARQGLKGAFYGKTGGDAKGKLIKEDFERHGLDTSHLECVEGKESPFCICIAETSTQTRKFIGKAADTPRLEVEDLDFEFLKNTRSMHFEGASPVVVAAATFAKENGILTCIDADGYRPEIEEHEDLFDLFIGSEFYAAKRLPGKEPIEVCREIAKKGCKVAIITLGAKGGVGIANGEEFSFPAFKGFKIIDTTGAGDVFHGAYLSAYLMGYDPKEAARYASAVSYIKCTRLGGRAGIPTREMTERFLKDGVLINEEELDARAKHYEDLVV